MTFKLEHPKDSFDDKLRILVDIRRKRDKNYHPNENMISFLRALSDRREPLELFIWFSDVEIVIGTPVTVKCPTEWIAEQIKGKYGYLLANYYKQEIEIK